MEELILVWLAVLINGKQKFIILPLYAFSKWWIIRMDNLDRL